MVALIAVLAGVGVGVLGRKTPGRSAASDAVRSALRQAHATATLQGAPAFCRFDAQRRTILAAGYQPVGLFHFEDELGAFGLSLQTGSGALGGQGRLGAGITFDPVLPRPYATASTAQRSAWRLRSGFRLEAWVLPRRISGMRVLSVGNRLQLGVDSEGAAVASVRLAPPTDEEGALARTEQTASAPGAVPAGRWTRLAAQYDGFELTVEVDGVVVARTPVSGPVDPGPDRGWGDLSISSSAAPFDGMIDEVRVWALVKGEETLLPEGFSFPADLVVHFAGGGRLDTAHHPGGPVEVPLESVAGPDVAFTVGVYGTLVRAEELP